MLVKTKGIIIKETPYSETSKILGILTSDYGEIGVLSKGCRTLKSKLRGVSQKLVYGDITINYKEKGLSTLIDLSVINSFKNIVNDLKKASYAFYIMDLVYQVLKENNDRSLYHLLESSLIKINDGLDESLITIIMELQLLKYLGVIINVDGCSLCGSSDNILTINSNDGGMICKNCYQNGYIVNPKTIKLLRLLYYVDICKIDKLEINDTSIFDELNNFIKEYYTKYTGVYLKNKSNIEKIRFFS